MKFVWEWLDGNKTVLGTLILAFLGTGILPEYTFGFAFLKWLGGFMAGGGIVHKILKGKHNTGK